MTWDGQVRAVFVKDLRQVWWMLALLAGVMLLAVLRMTAAPSVVNEMFGGHDTVISVLITWIVSAAVRADPPAVNTAFWSTQPLETSAVATAKLLQAVLIGVLSISAAGAMLWWSGTDRADLPGTLVARGLGAVTVAIAAAVFSTFTSDLRGVLLGAVLTLGAYFALDQFWPASVSRPGADWGRLAWLVVIGLDITAVLRLYRLREVSLPWRVGGGALVVATALCALASTRTVPKAEMPSAAALMHRVSGGALQ